MQIGKYSIYVWVELLEQGYLFKPKEEKAKLESTVPLEVEERIYAPVFTNGGMVRRQRALSAVYVFALGVAALVAVLTGAYIFLAQGQHIYLPTLILSSIVLCTLCGAAVRYTFLIIEDFRWKRHLRSGLPRDEFKLSDRVYMRPYELIFGAVWAVFFLPNPETGGIGVLSFFGVPGFSAAMVL